jgi:hypothetical protein
MESARLARERSSNHNTKEQPMLASDFKTKLAEAHKRLREATDDAGRTAANAAIDQLMGQEIDAPAVPVASLEALTESAPQVATALREAAKAEAATTIEGLQAQLKESNEARAKAETFVTSITDVRSLAESLHAAGITDEVDMKYYIGVAQTRGLREAADIKDMVDTDRAFHKKRADELTEAAREAADFGIEGAWGRLPAGDGAPSAEDGVASLRESGIPTRKPETAAA